MRIPHYWLYIFLVFTAALFFFYQEMQAPLSYDFAPAFDGNDYRLIYEYFTGQQEAYQVPFPFNQRILVPWLASLIGSDIVSSFQWMNLLFSLLAVWVLFKLWRQLGFELYAFWVGFGWLLLHWTGMIRLNAFDPITIDLPIFAFQGLILIVLFNRKFRWLLLLGPIACLQKESFLGLLVVLALYAIYHNRKQQDGYFDLKWIGASLILSLFTAQLAQYYFPALESDKNSIITLLYHAKQVFVHPDKLIRWVLAAFMAFGPFFIAGLLTGIRRRHYDLRKNLLLVFTLLYLAYGLLAGGDMTRIIFLGFPFVMTAILYELKEAPSKRLLLLSLLALPLMSLAGTLPDPAFEWERWQSWYPEFAGSTSLIMIGGYLIVCLLVLLISNKVRPRL